MSEHIATISWARRADEAFVDARYSREHAWAFDGGSIVLASSSPHVVPRPFSVESHVDPEEAFVASLSSCHLSIAAKRGYVVDRYVDNAVGVMSENAEGKLAMTRVTLRPRVVFSGKQPSREQIEKMHHQSHQQCFIANSVKTRVITEPVV